MSGAARQQIPRLVFTGTGGNIFTLAPTEGQVRQLTWSWWEEDKAGHTDSSRSIHAWPAWSQDGSRVAYFGLRETTGAALAASLYVVTADGVESWELTGLSGGMPIYGNWSPKADGFATLIQREERHLSLEIASLTQPGQTVPLVSGAPLFWSWSSRGDRLAAHVRGSRHADDARVVILDTTSGQIVREVTNRPGEFRVPAWSPQDDLLVYVEQGADNHGTLFLYDVETGKKGPVAPTRGATSALWSADGRFLAFGNTTRPGSLLFSSTKILDLATGKVTPLLDEAVSSFFWSPRGDRLFYLSVDTQHSRLCWHSLQRESGEKVTLARFLPSREQTFIFSFFDQYAGSHPPIAPDGSMLAFAGYLVGTAPLDTSTPSQIYVLSLDHPDGPRPIAQGQFVCWNLAS
jgi:Tol biopolymer transport system component